MNTLDKTKTLSSIEQIKAYADPYRMKIISEFYELKKPATVKQIADKMDEVPAKIYYHVKKLEKAGILKLSHTEEINGIIAKYYELTAEDFSLSSKDVNDASFNEFKSEVTKMIQKIYRESEQICLREIQKFEKDGKPIPDSKYPTGSVMCKEVLYATEEEMTQINELILEFAKKHEKESTEPGVNKYHFFNSIMTLDDGKK